MQPTYGDNWFREQQLAVGLTDHKVRCCRRDGAVAPAGCPEYATVFRSTGGEFFTFADGGAWQTGQGVLVTPAPNTSDLSAITVRNAGTDVEIDFRTNAVDFFAPPTADAVVNLYDDDTGVLVASVAVVQLNGTRYRMFVFDTNLVDSTTYRVEICGMVPA